MPPNASPLADVPSEAELARAADFIREPVLLGDEDASVALAHGTARRRAIDQALAEQSEGLSAPSTSWRRRWSLLLGLERMLSVDEPILADGKHVVVIGGGDTGSDCIGTSIRQGALSVTNFEIMPQPPEKENKLLTWPDWPLKLRTSSSHEEGAERDFAVGTVSFSGENGRVKTLHCARVDNKFKPVPGTEFDVKADLVLLAMGFVNPVDTMLNGFGVEKDARGNAKASTDIGGYKTNADKVFAAGDVRRGQSLVVWAIREGRQAAREVDQFLMGATTLPR